MSIPSLDDNLMYTATYAMKVFIELPGNQPGGACGMSFADGHAEIHKWQGSFANVPVIYSQALGVRQQVTVDITDPDMLYFAAHTPQH